MNEFLTFPFEYKQVDSGDKGIVTGYASTFGNVDLGLDVVDKGAFSKTIQQNKGRFPILADHSPTKQIGFNVEAFEDNKGLMVSGELDIKENQLARERFSLAKRGMELGVKVGLSIGYMSIKDEPDTDRPAIRRLKELKLFEYSFVTFPMNTEAMTLSAKNWNLSQEIDPEILTQVKLMIDNGKSKKEILKALDGAAYSELEPDKDLVHSITKLKNMFK